MLPCFDLLLVMHIRQIYTRSANAAIVLSSPMTSVTASNCVPSVDFPNHITLVNDACHTTVACSPKSAKLAASMVRGSGSYRTNYQESIVILPSHREPKLEDDRIISYIRNITKQTAYWDYVERIADTGGPYGDVSCV